MTLNFRTFWAWLRRTLAHGRTLLWVIVGIVTLAVVVWILSTCQREKAKPTPFVDSPAVLTSIKEVVRLSSAEIEQEIVVVDTLDKRVVAMIVKARSYVDFDLEKIAHHLEGDTLVVSLPPEKIQHYETGLWIVDHYSTSIFRSNRISAEEENQIKAQIPQRLTRSLYDKGHIATARKRARTDLVQFLGMYYDHVIVQDETPEGYYKEGIRKVDLPQEHSLSFSKEALSTRSR